jgi:hypothetical protein
MGRAERVGVMLGVLLPLMPAGVAGAQVVFAGGIGPWAGQAFTAQVSYSDEVQARQMMDWIRRRGRVPTQAELNQDASLQQMWSSYQRWQNQERARQAAAAAEARRQAQLLAAQNDARGKRALQDALDNLAARKYQDAIKGFSAILANPAFANQHAEAKTKLGEIDQAGAGEVSAAKQLVTSGKYQEAMDRLGNLVLRFRGVPAGDAAAKELLALQADPDVKAKMRKADAALVLANADKAWADQQYLSAFSFYDAVAAAYPDLDEGKTAAAKVAEIKANAEVWPLIEKARAEAECKSLLATAKTCFTNNLNDRGTAALLELVQKHPDTAEADEARTILIQLGVPAPARAPTSRPTAPAAGKPAA